MVGSGGCGMYLLVCGIEFSSIIQVEFRIVQGIKVVIIFSVYKHAAIWFSLGLSWIGNGNRKFEKKKGYFGIILNFFNDVINTCKKRTNTSSTAAQDIRKSLSRSF